MVAKSDHLSINKLCLISYRYIAKIILQMQKYNLQIKIRI